MAPPIRTPANAWIDAGLRVLADGGPDAVRIEPLARSLGVTRGGFYGHFHDRAALLEAMLDRWERAATDEVREQVEQRGGDARHESAARRRAHVQRRAAADRARDPHWARHDPSVAARLKRVDNQRMEYLRELFGELCVDEDEVEGRAVLAFSLAIGYHFIAADHGARDRGDAVELAVRQLLA